MAVSIDDIKKLKELTGVGLTDAKNALVEAEGDFDKALEAMRKKGLTKAEKKADREALEGVIDSYVHGGRIGVLVEVNCETDFVANTDDFKNLAKDLAMHVASTAPLSVSAEGIDETVIERERAVYLEQVKEEGKPEHIAERIIEGKLQKFFKESALLAQPFVKDPDKTIEQLITEVSSKTGEKIEVARFVRFKVGEFS